ncbi:NTP transferase domain-containing protein [Candidatus Falkowbacteria bacterium]|nr:NTP transferase domain-containing protein [Candidatus Falkowbacteria bacterium]
MKPELENFGVVILAAGQGKRLGCVDLPKVLHEINEKPIISYILEELEKGGLAKSQICLVVGFKAESVKEKIGSGYIYALQAERLGTAHAALIGEEALPADFNNFLAINGDDSAFYKFNSLAELINMHLENNNDISILTCEPDDLSGLGRIVRWYNSEVFEIVEKENLMPEMEKIREINTNTFCFKREWFKNHYYNLRPIAGLEEYGLPSFVGEALASNSKFSAVKLKNANEWFGINTSEQLAEADKRKREQFYGA